MGKKERQAKKAQQKAKTAVVVFGKGVGLVTQAVDTHLSKQGVRAQVFKQAEAHGPVWGISMSIPDRMEQTCPMCGSETMWDCKCSDMDNNESTGCLNDWDELEEAAVQAWTSQSVDDSKDDQEPEPLQSGSDAGSDQEQSTPVRGRMVMPDQPFHSPDSVASFPTSTFSSTDIDFNDPPQHGFRGELRRVINLSLTNLSTTAK
jgi:hypothetical protein